MNQPRFSSRPRIALLIAVFLLLGAIVNLSVAWALAAWAVPAGMGYGTYALTAGKPPCWSLHQFTSWGYRFTKARAMMPGTMMIGGNNPPTQYEAFERMVRISPGVPQELIDEFSSLALPNSRAQWHEVDERGWPLVCMRSRSVYEVYGTRDRPVRNVVVTDGIALQPEETIRGGWAFQRVRALPLNVHWPQMIFNTLFYAGFLAIVIVGFPLLIRSLGRRRAVIYSIFSFLIGAMTTFAVVWGSAVWVDLESYRMPASAHSPINISNETRLLGIQIEYHRTTTRVKYLLSRKGQESSDPPVKNIEPYWSTRPDNFEPFKPTPFYTHIVHGRGWPMHAMWSAYQSMLLDPEPTVIHGYWLADAPTQSTMPMSSFRLLPTQIIWPGFLINSALTAAAIFPVLTMPGVLIRHRRRQRDRCVHCGYDLRGNLGIGEGVICPECGKLTQRPALVESP